MEYGLITVRNNTDEYKTVRVFRVIHDGERYKTVGEPIARVFEPMVESTLRISPGMVLVCVDKINGAPWMQVFVVSLCKTISINMDAPVMLEDFPAIQSRSNARPCPPCPPCPPPPKEKQ